MVFVKKENCMLERIVKHKWTPLIIKSAAITHLSGLLFKLIAGSNIPEWADTFLSYFLEVTMAILVAVVVLNALCSVIDKKYISDDSHYLLKDSIILILTIIISALIFLDDEIEEQSILFITKSLPLTTLHLKMVSDAFMIFFMGQEIISIYTYSNHSLEKGFAQEKIKGHMKAFAIKSFIMLIIYVVSKNI